MLLRSIQGFILNIHGYFPFLSNENRLFQNGSLSKFLELLFNVLYPYFIRCYRWAAICQTNTVILYLFCVNYCFTVNLT